MAYRVWLFIWLGTGFWTSPANATNIHFLPGDAFFYTRLTKESCEELQKDEGFSLRCLTSELSPGSFCGYVGYEQLRLPPSSRPLITNLVQAYTEVRKSSWRELTEEQDYKGQIKLQETNGLPIFIYNESFDPQIHSIGLKYNESWVEDEMAFGVRKNLTRLDVFDSNPLVFGEDWRDSREVPPLKVKCPPITDLEKRLKYGSGGDVVTEPVFCDGPVQIILVDVPNLKSYFQARNKYDFYVIKSTGVTKHFTDEEGDRVFEPWSPKSETKDSSPTTPEIRD